MKKKSFVILMSFLTLAAFAQDGTEKKGYFNTTQISIMMGHKSVTEPANSNYRPPANLLVSPSVTMTHGGMIDQHWALGVGLGIELFEHKLFPLFADVRYFVRDNTVSPFFAFKFGYAIGNLNKKHYDVLQLDFQPYHINNAYLKHNGGLMLHPEMGVRFPLNESSELLITVAYRHQKAKTTVSQDFGLHNTWERKANMNRLSFGAAITFK